VQPLSFVSQAAQIRNDQAEKTRASLSFLQNVDRKCVTFEAVIEVPDVRLGVLRAEVAKPLLMNAGLLEEGIRLSVHVVDRFRPFSEAILHWSWAKGRLRCDPTTKRTGPTPMCLPDFEACCWELTDGTVCNTGNVPNPVPAKYSVILGYE
jgi:hypothetical protein